MKAPPPRTKKSSQEALRFMGGAKFGRFAATSKTHLARICKNLNLYPTPAPNDYHYTEFFAGATEPRCLQVRLETGSLAAAAQVNICAYIKLAGHLTAHWLGPGKAGERCLALFLDMAWEYVPHADLTPEANLLAAPTSPVFTAVFDCAGKLAGLTTDIKSPEQIKLHTQLQDVGRQIVYYKKQRELADRCAQAAATRAARAQKLCVPGNALARAGIIIAPAAA